MGIVKSMSDQAAYHAEIWIFLDQKQDYDMQDAEAQAE
jgi:hypothetical protein